jgi:hypothetical protein
MSASLFVHAGDVVSSVILAAGAATAACMAINEYTDAAPSAAADPMVVHAGTSTTYPISFCEAFYAGLDFVRQNPPAVRLPGAALFTLPLDYRPDEEAVKRCKYWTGWKVRDCLVFCMCCSFGAPVCMRVVPLCVAMVLMCQWVY